MRDNRGTSPRSDKAAHVIGTSGGRPCASAWLARPMSTTMVIGKAPEVVAEPARETAGNKGTLGCQPGAIRAGLL